MTKNKLPRQQGNEGKASSSSSTKSVVKKTTKNTIPSKASSSSSKSSVVKPSYNANNNNNMKDWIASLAKQTTSSNQLPTKEERASRREAKKERREAKRPLPTDDDDDDPRIANNTKKRKEESLSRPRPQSLDPIVSKHRLHLLSSLLRSVCRSIAQDAKDQKKRPIPFHQAGASNQTLHKKRKAWDEPSVQPRSRDYGGIGLARRSMFLGFADPSFFPKLEQEFSEHIPGFFGKQRTNAMKKQLNANMLWRQLAKAKEDKHAMLHGRKLADMTPDERVQAMIDAGKL
jgi:hypothetical protein